ncbi:hypothetical protein ACOJAZ_14090, partial [Corynebacterium striatum]|uniref:hypothetical protein n=1 Tax=Corynebacterium striatum TaxID=43770 RepID=UPI003B5C48B5
HQFDARRKSLSIMTTRTIWNQLLTMGKEIRMLIITPNLLHRCVLSAGSWYRGYGSVVLPVSG